MIEFRTEFGQIKGKISGDTDELTADLVHAICFIYTEYLQKDITLEDFAKILNKTMLQYVDIKKSDNKNEN